jgi:peroxiredoxin Q/BCP
VCRRLSLSLSVPTAAAVLMAIAIGSAAPTFECQSHTGATLKLADYAGKKLLIWFYPRACTGG